MLLIWLQLPKTTLESVQVLPTSSEPLQPTRVMHETQQSYGVELGMVRRARGATAVPLPMLAPLIVDTMFWGPHAA